MTTTLGKSAASKPSSDEIFNTALKKAMGGGLAGASAMVCQVTSLMWMRTTINYQYRYGTSTKEAFQTLYKDGGLRRFYRGYGPAMLQGPLSRFGDTAANSGVLAYMDADPRTANLPTGAKSAVASLAASSWRIFLMPLDTMKTTMQVEGAGGLGKVMAKARTGGPGVFYHGALAAAGATYVGHFPWFFTFNTLNAKLPVPDSFFAQLGRSAVIGFCCSLVSDTCSNSIRVVKVFRQTNEQAVTYPQAVKEIVAKDGLMGLFGRGLKTKIIANGMQGIMFAVLWKFFETKINGEDEK